MAIKTKEKPPLFDFEALALRMVDGDPEALTLARWAKARKTESALEHRAAVLRLILVCEELHAPGLSGESLTPKQRAETLKTLRHRLCEEALGLEFRLVTRTKERLISEKRRDESPVLLENGAEVFAPEPGTTAELLARVEALEARFSPARLAARLWPQWSEIGSRQALEGAIADATGGAL